MALSLLFLSAELPLLCFAQYYLSPNRMTWSNAESFCQQHCHSNLLSLHSAEELDDVEDLLSNDFSTNYYLDEHLWRG